MAYQIIITTTIIGVHAKFLAFLVGKAKNNEITKKVKFT